MNIQQITLDHRGPHDLTFNKPGAYIVFFSNLSLKATFSIEAEGVALFIFGWYDIKKNERFTLHTVQNHISPHSTSRLLIKAVAHQKGKLDFIGRISIAKKAQRSHAYQKSEALLLGDSCFVDMRPELEIQADDVFCTHGSTSGTIPKESLYYIMQRSISRTAAQRLYIRGFKQDLLQQMNQVRKSNNYADTEN